jgi:hypothetical protein
LYRIDRSCSGRHPKPFTEADIAVVELEGCARAEIDTMISEGLLYAEPAVDEMKA